MGLEYKNSRHLAQRLDAGFYHDNETVTLKIPLSIPYYPDTDFERVDGEIEHNGDFYRLVKQKLHQDTLHIVCIRDEQRSVVKQALADYVKTFADQSADRSQHSKIPPFIKDYLSTAANLSELTTGWSAIIVASGYEDSVSTPYLSFSAPPPRPWTI
jgi:hypothetical protein